MPHSPEGRMQEPWNLDAEFRDMLRLEKGKDGFDYGESSSAKELQGRTQEFECISKLASVYAATDIGGKHSKYSVNEDSMFVLAKPEHMVLGVIDGGGGSEEGEGRMASRIVAGVLASAFRQGRAMEEAMQGAHARILEYPKRIFAAGVVVSVGDVRQKDLVTLGYAGDCRALTVRSGKKLAPGTTPSQNLAYAFLEGTGTEHEYYTHKRLNILTGGFGTRAARESEYKPDIQTFMGARGDIIIVASDGLWSNVSDYEVVRLAKQCKTAQALALKLRALADARNNTLEPFTIQHDAHKKVQKTLSCRDTEGKVRKRGDNITVAVMELTNI